MSDDKKEITLVADNLNLPDTPLEKQKKEYSEDYDFVKRKTKSLINTAEEAIEHLKDVAIETCDPRAFRVLAEMLTTTGGLVKNITDNSRNKAEIDKSITKEEIIAPAGIQQNTTNNTTIFVGSTKDLLDKIKNEKIIEHEPTTE